MKAIWVNSLRNTRDVVLQVSEKVIIYLKQMFLAICQKKEIPDNVWLSGIFLNYFFEFQWSAWGSNTLYYASVTIWLSTFLRYRVCEVLRFHPVLPAAFYSGIHPSIMLQSYEISIWYANLWATNWT